ncbi:hypothetical protein HRED_09112 [Candidatus Haloredivivus sp. G17]|nr:hypothetical protein HRED_09112 [Candidatus Haloredivivus sp. G17]
MRNISEIPLLHQLKIQIELKIAKTIMRMIDVPTVVLIFELERLV